MCLRRMIAWFGRRIGWTAHVTWKIIAKLLLFGGLAFLIILGSILAFLGNVILLLLTGLGTLCVLILRVFAWFTYKLMCVTKDFGKLVSSYTETFFDSIYSAFRKEEEELQNQLPIHIVVESR